VRAVLVDKDNQPALATGILAEVDEAMVDGHFAPLGERELHFLYGSDFVEPLQWQ